MFIMCMRHGRAFCSECHNKKTERIYDMDIYKLQCATWRIAEEKGWHEGEPISFGEFIALCHSELSEALEIYRNHGSSVVNKLCETSTYKGLIQKPEGIPIELADVIMRILDYSETHGINMEKAIETKMRFNRTREYRHGNKML